MGKIGGIDLRGFGFYEAGFDMGKIGAMPVVSLSRFRRKINDGRSGLIPLYPSDGRLTGGVTSISPSLPLPPFRFRSLSYPCRRQGKEKVEFGRSFGVRKPYTGGRLESEKILCGLSQCVGKITTNKKYIL